MPGRGHVLHISALRLRRHGREGGEGEGAIRVACLFRRWIAALYSGEGRRERSRFVAGPRGFDGDLSAISEGGKGKGKIASVARKTIKGVKKSSMAGRKRRGKGTVFFQDQE